jgi:hypothetical protein
MDDPRREVSAAELDSIRDADARENYRVVLRLRQRLLASESLEACYRGLFRGGVDVPPLFVDQLVHVILRGMLEGCDEPLRLRAAELFFREQSATVRDGHVLLADLETVQRHAARQPAAGLAALIAEAGGGLERAELDVLDAANAGLYWERESRHDTVIRFNHGSAALEAYCRVIEAWVAHFTSLRVAVRPLARIDEPRWAWHIGLDAQSSATLNDLWRGEPVEPGRLSRILALARMDFADAAEMRPGVAGRPVYLALSCDEAGVVRMKPQNLLLNLPLNET